MKQENQTLAAANMILLIIWLIFNLAILPTTICVTGEAVIENGFYWFKLRNLYWPVFLVPC
jgi:hypothetical protein